MKKTILLITIFTTLISFSQTMRLDSIKNSDMRIVFNYDNLSLQVDLFENNNSIWNKTSSIFITYNSNDLKDIEILRGWDGSNYINDDKVEYTYNSNLKVETEEMYDWNENDNNWTDIGTKTYTYSNDNLDYIIETYPNNPNSKKKINYVYDNDILIKTEEYDWENNEWQQNPSNKNEFSYDNYGNIVSDITSYYINGVWNSEGEINYNYDTSISNLIIPNITKEIGAITPIVYNNLITSITLDNSINLTYHYSTVNTASVYDFNKSLTVHPNPANNQVKFEIENFRNIEIYNLNGNKMIKTKSNIINIENFANGVYFYKIYKEKEILTGKLIKK